VAENLAELAEIARGEEDYWENEIAGWLERLCNGRNLTGPSRFRAQPDPDLSLRRSLDAVPFDRLSPMR